MDESTGHLSRNWNQALLHGFRNLMQPAVDRVIAVQVDCRLTTKWYTEVSKLSLKFLACGRGDEFQAFTPEGVRAVGMYDERFCNIGFQEADYFLRAYLTLKNDCAIIDPIHGRYWNPTNVEQSIVSNHHEGFNDAHIKSTAHHNRSRAVFNYKWGATDPQNWPTAFQTAGPRHKMFMFYPYFENAIDQSVYEIN
jgi:hypothetical protein